MYKLKIDNKIDLVFNSKGFKFVLYGTKVTKNDLIYWDEFYYYYYPYFNNVISEEINTKIFNFLNNLPSQTESKMLYTIIKAITIAINDKKK